MFSSVTSDQNESIAKTDKKGKHNALLTFPLNLPLNKLVKYHRPAPQSKKSRQNQMLKKKKSHKSTLVAALFPSSQPSIPRAYSVKPRTQPHVNAVNFPSRPGDY